MMRENESDGEDGWHQPSEDIIPWSPGAAGEADQESGIWGHEASAPGTGGRETIAFGLPDDDDGPAGPDGGQQDLWYGRYRGPGGYGRGDDSAGWQLPAPPPPRRPRRGGNFLIYLTVAVLAAVIGAGLTVTLDRHSAGAASGASGISSRDIPVPSGNAAGSSPTLSQTGVEAKVEPGLVDIDATLKYASETAEGTGMVINPDGLVLTNNHVIYGATSVTATLAGSGRLFQARVIGYDDPDDVALLQLTGASGLATVSFGDSSQVRLGAPVLALGNAEGRGGVRPAAGIINGLNRSIEASDQGSDTTEYLNHMLETDAQIQQGDSGGALANSAGQVIGMVTAANTSSGGQQGGTAGFAIPINSALVIARQIAAGQASSTVHIGLPGFLGVEVSQSNSPSPQQQAADAQQAAPGPACVNGGQQPGTPASIAPAATGALVLGVVCGTAASSGGLVPGDVITSVNGQAITTPGSLTAVTSGYRPGAVVTVRWQSVNGAEHTMRFALGIGPAR